MDAEKSESIPSPVTVGEDDIRKLLSHFARNSHRVKSADIKGETIMEICMMLFRQDYKFTVVANHGGELCGHYPMKLIIIEFERTPQSSAEILESTYNHHHLMQAIKNARCARCRSRFVMPVIFYQGKHICRSATLSGGAEMFGRSTTDYLLSNQNMSGRNDTGRIDMFDKFRGHDIQLLKLFNVRFICDLMVEKKKTKFYMPVSSSEKVDKENRYSDFTLLVMPYPGCEVFKDWKDNSYNRETVYDWGQAMNDSKLELPPSELLDELGLDWSKYTEWNLVVLTQNYLKLLLQYIKKESSGLLVHCISGWDRTPLYISLLRLSLWADGVIHQSLNATEILYLTLGYDWYLFGHDLPDRLSNDQEVLFFCFKFLPDIASEDFSVLQRSQTLPNTSSSAQLDGAEIPKGPSGNLPSQQHRRLGSDSSLGLHGVLLSEDLMSFPAKGSSNSLNSTSSNETTDHINFTLGVHEEEENGVEGAVSKQAVSSSKFSHRRSLSPSSRVTARIRHSSPVSAGQRRRKSSDSQPLSIHSNHFVGSPLARPSSPMQVPQKAECMTSLQSATNSIGSWQIIPSSDNLRGLISDSSNSHSSADRSSNVSSCMEALEINVATMRWQRLDAVSRLFNSAYSSAVQSQNLPRSSSSGFTSFFDRVAEHVGLKGSKPRGATGASRAV